MRYCAVPTCDVLVESGRCLEHKRAADVARGSARERGYTPAWATYSRGRLRRLPLCGQRQDGQRYAEHSVCTAEGRIVAATVTDHIVPPSTAGDDRAAWSRLFWDKANHQSLCKACHDRKTVTVDRGFGRPRGGRGA